MNNFKLDPQGSQQRSIQEIVKSMVEQYSHPAVNRREDLARVLGDPLKGIGLRGATSSAPEGAVKTHRAST